MNAPSSAEPRRPASAILAVAALSGFAGLGYEMVWTRSLANAFGHELVAVLGVIAALFGGLALGSLLLGRRIAASRHPGRWYVGLELAIGAWGLALIGLLPALSNVVPVLTPVDASALRQWTVAFAVPSLVLLPATLAMGATLPALEAILTARIGAGRWVAWVYAANTFGAVAGTLATTFWIVPAVGLARTMMALGSVNVGCAAVIALLAAGATAPAHAVATPIGNRSRRLVSLFVTGLLGIGYEVVAIRTMSQVLENTVYTFAALLAVYLLGTSIGAAFYGRLRASRGEGTTAPLAAAASLCCALGTLALARLDGLQAMLRETAPHTVAGAVTSELAIAAMVFLLPTIAMGALFSHLTQASRDGDGTMGPALAANTAGAALAPMLFGPLLLPALGAKIVLALVAFGYALVAPRWSRRDIATRTVAAALAVIVVVTAPSLRFIQVPPGGEVLWHRDGVMAAVSVVEDRNGDRHLEINSHFRMGGTASIRSDYREADIPLLLHGDPRRALFLGLGTGATVSAAADHPALTIDGVELVPEVPEAFPLFAKGAPNIGRSKRLHIHSADARRYVAASDERYDVVVADVYHPWVDGAGSLYTREHFAAIKRRLEEEGIFCQWLPLHQLDLPTLQLIVRTYLAVFPNASAYLAQLSVNTPLIGLIGTREPRPYPVDWLGRRVSDPGLKARLAAVDLADDTALFGLYLAGSDELSAFAGTGPLNTDDRPEVTFSSPRIAYDEGETPGDRLLALLATFHPRPYEIYGADAGSGDEGRLDAYWQARDRFLELGVRTAESPAMRDVIAELAPRLIDLVRISPDFDPAYKPVLAMARQLQRTNPDAARRLVQELDRANPARPEARQLLAGFAADGAAHD